MEGHNRCLYGGAISCRIPQQFEDLRELKTAARVLRIKHRRPSNKQVVIHYTPTYLVKLHLCSSILPLPDHQEVFVYHLNNAEEGHSSSNPYTSDCVLSFELLDYVNDKDEESIARYLFDDLVACNEATCSSIYMWKPSELPNSLGGTNYKAILVTGSMHVARGQREHKTKTRHISAFLYIVRLPTYSIDILVTYNFPLDDENINYEKELCMFEQMVSTLEILDTNLFLHKPV